MMIQHEVLEVCMVFNVVFPPQIVRKQLVSCSFSDGLCCCGCSPFHCGDKVKERVVHIEQNSSVGGFQKGFLHNALIVVFREAT